MTVVIHHNPSCGTSRNVPEILQAAGDTPMVIPYLDTGWTRPHLSALFAADGLTPRTGLRSSKSPAEAMGLTDPAVRDLIDHWPPGPHYKEDGTTILTEKGTRLD